MLNVIWELIIQFFKDIIDIIFLELDLDFGTEEY